MSRKATDLQTRVEGFLQQRHVLKKVNVEAAHGRVTIRGRVGSFYEKQLCLSCYGNVPGIAHLVDQIEVVRAATP